MSTEDDAKRCEEAIQRLIAGFLVTALDPQGHRYEPLARVWLDMAVAKVSSQRENWRERTDLVLEIMERYRAQHEAWRTGQHCMLYEPSAPAPQPRPWVPAWLWRLVSTTSPTRREAAFTEGQPTP